MNPFGLVVVRTNDYYICYKHLPASDDVQTQETLRDRQLNND